MTSVTELRRIPGVDESTARRLEAAGFGPEALARARPSELVKRASLRADLARRIVAHARDSAEEDGHDGEEAGGLLDRLEGWEWERVWEFKELPRGRGKISLRVSLFRGGGS